MIIIPYLIVFYLFCAIPNYFIAKKEGLKNPGMIFIPFISDIKTFNMINKSGLFTIPLFLLIFFYILNIHVLIVLFSIIYTILKAYRNYLLFKYFDFTIAGCILGIFFTFIARWFIAFDSKTIFCIDLIDKYKERSTL